MRVLVNAVSAKMGGAVNYIKEIASELARINSEADFIFLVPPEHREGIQALAPNVRVVASEMAHAPVWKRFWFDQIELYRYIRQHNIGVLFSTANTGTLLCPCRQILLVRNSLYFSKLYQERFVAKQRLTKRVALKLRRMLAFCSIRAADVLMVPSNAILNEIRNYIGVPHSKAVVNPYGVNRKDFHNATNPHATNKSFALLFTSLYADHKNLRTLLLAIKDLIHRGTDVHLTTTADPHSPQAQGTQNANGDAQLANSPLLRNCIRFAMKDAATAPKNLYRDADIFVYPSVVESFGHALAEAMSSGLPIIAADVPINRELCGDGALYHSPFDADDLSRKILQIVNDDESRLALSNKAYERSKLFSWERHVQVLLQCMQVEKTVSSRHSNEISDVRA